MILLIKLVVVYISVYNFTKSFNKVNLFNKINILNLASILRNTPYYRRRSTLYRGVLPPIHV